MAEWSTSWSGKASPSEWDTAEPVSECLCLFTWSWNTLPPPACNQQCRKHVGAWGQLGLSRAHWGVSERRSSIQGGWRGAKWAGVHFQRRNGKAGDGNRELKAWHPCFHVKFLNVSKEKQHCASILYFKHCLNLKTIEEEESDQLTSLADIVPATAELKHVWRWLVLEQTESESGSDFL